MVDWGDVLADMDIFGEGNHEEHVHLASWGAELTNLVEHEARSLAHGPADEAGGGSSALSDEAPIFGDTGEQEDNNDGAQDMEDVGKQALALLSKPLGFLEKFDALARASRTVDDKELDAHMVDASTYFVTIKVNVANDESTANLLQTDRKLVRAARSLSACAAVQLERAMWRWLETLLADHAAAGTVKLVCFLEFVSYDGVDLKVETKAETKTSQHLLAGAAPPVVDHPDGVAPAAPASSYDVCVGKAKLLNLDSEAAMILEVRGKLVAIRTQFLTWLQCVDRNTGEAILGALLQQSCGTDAREKFIRRVRVATTDAAGYNFRAENGWKAQHPQSSHLHFRCDVHVTSAVISTVFGLLPQCIKGMTAIALSLGQFGQISLFRASFRKVLSQMLRLVYDLPSKQAMNYRDSVIDVFLGQSQRHAPLRMVLSRCASGDWRRTDVFEYFASPGDTRESVVNLLHEQFVPALLGHSPRTWPRNRWTGFDDSLLDIGLLSCIHGLLPRVYRDYVETNYPVSRKRHATDSAKDAPAILGRPEDDDATPAQGAIDQNDWAAENRAHRKDSVEWLKGDWRSTLAIMRIVLDPMMRVLQKGLEMSGALKETQQAEVFLSEFKKNGSATLFQRDHTPLLMAAGGSAERKCLEDLELLHHADHYMGLLAHDITISTSHLIFRMLSREASSVYQRLVVRHRCFPYKLFLLLLDAPDAAHLEPYCEPSLDEYSKSFLTHFQGNLHSKEARLELAMVALWARTNTVKLESANATIRRRLVVASVQSKVPRLDKVSAETLLGNLRRREHERKHPRGDPQHWRSLEARKSGMKKGSRRRRGGKKPPRRGGGGGAWRAFVSARCRGVTKAIFRELAREYAQLTAQEKQMYTEAGATGTIAHRVGGHAFGLVARELAMALEKRRILQLAGGADESEVRVLPYDTGKKALAIQTHALGASIRQAKADLRILRAIEAKRHELVAEALAEWRAGASFRTRDELIMTLPGLAKAAPGVHAQPPMPGADFTAHVQPPLGLQVPRLLGMRNVPGVNRFLDALSAEWERMHLVAKHEDQEPIGNEDKPNYKAKLACLLAQFCLCGERGDRIWSLKLRMCAAMKKALAGATPKVNGGYVVLRVTGFDFEPPSDFHEQEALYEDTIVCDFFAHVSTMCWSPYRPTFRRLSWPAKSLDALARLRLMATHTYRTLLELLAEIVDTDPGSLLLTMYELVDAEEPIARVSPLSLWAVEMQGTSPQTLVLKRRNEPHHRRALCDRDPGWGDALLAFGELDQGQEEECVEGEGVLSDFDGSQGSAEHLSESAESEGSHEAMEDLRSECEQNFEGGRGGVGLDRVGLGTRAGPRIPQTVGPM